MALLHEVRIRRNALQFGQPSLGVVDYRLQYYTPAGATDAHPVSLETKFPRQANRLTTAILK